MCFPNCTSYSSASLAQPVITPSGVMLEKSGYSEIRMMGLVSGVSGGTSGRLEV